MVLGTLSVLLLPIVPVMGYMSRVLESSSRGESVPTFDDWGDLFVRGMMTAVVVLCYAFIGATAVVVVGVLSLVLGHIGFGGSLVGILFFVVLGLFLVAMALPVWFFVPALMTNFVHEGRLGAAFNWKTIRTVALDRRYLGRWFVGFCLAGIGKVLYALFGGTLAVVTMLDSGSSSVLVGGLRVVGTLVWSAVSFYCQVAAAYCFDRGYAAATDRQMTVSDQYRPVHTGDERRTTRDGEWGAIRDDTASESEWGEESAEWRERHSRSRFSNSDE